VLHALVATLHTCSCCKPCWCWSDSWQQQQQQRRQGLVEEQSLHLLQALIFVVR
jgi:hypothetical protein